MKIKKIIYSCVFVLHLLVSLIAAVIAPLFSNFLFTFLLIYLFSLPLITGVIALVNMIIDLCKKQRSINSVLCGAIGSIIVMIYLLSLIGLIAALDRFGMFLAIIPFGTLSIFVLWIIKAVLNKKKESKTN